MLDGICFACDGEGVLLYKSSFYLSTTDPISSCRRNSNSDRVWVLIVGENLEIFFKQTIAASDAAQANAIFKSELDALNRRHPDDQIQVIVGKVNQRWRDALSELKGEASAANCPINKANNYDSSLPWHS